MPRMKIIVKTPSSRRAVVVERPEELDSKLKSTFGVDEYQIFEDAAYTVPYDLGKLKDGALVHMKMEMKTQVAPAPSFDCDHSENIICPKCATLDPLDKRRASKDLKKTKYLSRESFEQFLKERKQSEDEYTDVLKKCPDHPANVTCTKCMDKVITLVPQLFRYTDYVEFDSKDYVEQMITKWKETQKQSVGFLLGKIVPHTEYPGGRKAVVSAIWEVDQERFPDGAVLNHIPTGFICPGLDIVGVVYTDLFMRNGTLFSHKLDRGYVVSAMELNFFYEVQSIVKSPYMVGICVSLQEDGAVGLQCFMVSEQFKGLMQAQALELTTDPTRFKTNRDLKYVVRNEYDKDVKIDAKPYVPIEYFIVTCEAGYLDKPLFSNTTPI